MADDPKANLRIAKLVAREHMQRKTGMSRTAGEVRFIKDKGDVSRQLDKGYNYNPKAKKPLAKVLWSISCALGHMVSAQSTFTKIKAVSISPDGMLGGRGYIQEISDMRSGLTGAIAALSAIQDTIHDEIHADHWDPDAVGTSDEDEAEIDEMLSDSEEINEDPEGYVEEEYEEEVVEDVEKKEKKAARRVPRDVQAALDSIRGSHPAGGVKSALRRLRKELDRKGYDLLFNDTSYVASHEKGDSVSVKDYDYTILNGGQVVGDVSIMASQKDGRVELDWV